MLLRGHKLIGLATGLSLAAIGLLILAPGCVIQSASVSSDGGSDGAYGNGSDGGDSCVAGQASCNGTCADITVDDNNCGAGSCATVCSGGQHCVGGLCRASNIEHVVLIVQENHSFDSYFGMYCQAAAKSNPSCTSGRACCEGPLIVGNNYVEPRGALALILDDDPNRDSSNFKHDRAHSQACELLQIDNGAMDRFVSGTTGGDYCKGVGPDCSSPNNWVLANGTAPTDTVSYYWTLADTHALADRYFQPVAGGTASNNMYFAGAQFRFQDNDRMPDVAVGTDYLGSRVFNPFGLCVDAVGCINTQPAKPPYPVNTVAGVLLDHGKTFGMYADGYAEALAAAKTGQCASAPAYCPYNSCIAHPVACNGCIYDPSDVPFLYYARFADAVTAGGRVPTPYINDYAALQQDLTNQTLPNFSFVKARLYHNEHPNMSTIQAGEAFVMSTVNMILKSSYQSNTLILLTWDEGGGFFDHVAPPAAPPISVDMDNNGAPVPYGTRVPFLAIGAFAKTGTVSHVVMEHSSIVKFLEYNFATEVGQLNARDKWVNNIGSLLDPSKTGIHIPEGK